MLKTVIAKLTKVLGTMLLAPRTKTTMHLHRNNFTTIEIGKIQLNMAAYQDRRWMRIYRIFFIYFVFNVHPLGHAATHWLLENGKITYEVALLCTRQLNYLQIMASRKTNPARKNLQWDASKLRGIISDITDSITSY